MWNSTHRSRNLDTAGIWFTRCMRSLLALLWMILILGGLAACSGVAPSTCAYPHGLTVG